MLKGLNQGIKILIFSCLASLAAFAQAEIAPDHCDDQSSSASAVAKPGLAAQIAATEKQLAAVRAEMQSLAQRIEESHQEVISAGIQGDSAAGFINAFKQEEKQLNARIQSLMPQVESLQASLAQLRGQQEAVTAAATVRKPRKAHATLRTVSVRSR